MTTQLYQAAQDLANLAEGVRRAHAKEVPEQLPSSATDFIKPYLDIKVQVGYKRTTVIEGEAKTRDFSATKIDLLVREYMMTHLPSALQFAANVLRDEADALLIASKNQVLETLARIEALEVQRDVQS